MSTAALQKEQENWRNFLLHKDYKDAPCLILFYSIVPEMLQLTNSFPLNLCLGKGR